MASNDFKSVQDKIQTALVATTRRTNQIAAEDLGFHRSSNPTAGEQLDETSERLLALSTSLLGAASKGTDLKAPDLEDADDVDVHWSRIVDVIDTLLEKADTCLDEYTGLVKRKGAPTEENAPQAKKPKTFTALDSSMRRANILKPQNAFEVKPDNSDTSPWKPLLTKKPHASVSLDESLGTFNNENGTIQHKHPYETEILKLEYPSSIYETREPIPYQPMETTSATFVNTFEGVLDMLAELKKAKEIAIDTEHHDFRTYSGLLSLMQISTRDKDWIVDTLQPWRHKLEVLNEVFADPKIIKVLHGAYMDIIWLQRDLGLYVVGLFDTFHAAEALGYSAKSLAYLLKRFIDFDADKKYQMADWRIRPIPDEMFYYARSDTHFLLHIYDMMRNELLARSNRDNPEEDYMTHVLERSKEVSLRRYERFIYDAAGGQGPFGWYNMLIKSSGNLTREQFSVFRAVHKWRDDMARREDESPGFIFSNAALFDIAKRLPPDPKALHSILGFPSSHASNLARQLSADLFKVVDQAKTEGANGPTLSDFFRSNTVGIGEVAKQVFPKLAQTPEEGALDTKELVAGGSRLWGDVPVSSRWENTPVVNKGASSARFALPWAAFLENAAVSGTAVETELPSRAAPAPQADVEPRDDEEFTLKSGRKRKAPEPEAEDEEEGEAAPGTQSQSGELGEEEITFVGSSDEEEARKARKKEEKKARKELKKAEKQAAKEAQKTAQANGTEGKEDEEGEEDDDAPFDYSQAKSVLRGKREKKGGKAFNPYSSLNAEGPKAARRMHHEKTGKTATFKKI